MLVKAKNHVEFMCEIDVDLAHCHGRFVHEHLAEATSWNIEAVVADSGPRGSRNSEDRSAHLRPLHVEEERQGHARTAKNEVDDELS